MHHGTRAMVRPNSAFLAALAVMASGTATQSLAQARDTSAIRAERRGTSEVTAFLRRRSACSRLATDDGDDPERVAESVRARFGLKCATLQEEESRLRARYDNRPKVIEDLDRDDALDVGGE